jgi:tRNA (guanine-N7-)-methyltransferase
MTENASHQRSIRSFVQRQGRITVSQQRALDELMPRFGLQHQAESFDLPAIFGRSAPLWLEIGFGNGDSLAEIAANHPDIDFIGIEVHLPGVGKLLNSIEQRELTNLRVICHDAVEILRDCIPDGALARLLLFFPDPWHKKRHHKRRIVSPDFAELVRQKLAVGGVWHMATDWEPYAEWMLEHMDAAPGYANTAGKGQCGERPNYRPETKFERRGLKLGHGVWDLLYRRDS